jgi:hypothetical protein
MCIGEVFLEVSNQFFDCTFVNEERENFVSAERTKQCETKLRVFS